MCRLEGYGFGRCGFPRGVGCARCRGWAWPGSGDALGFGGNFGQRLGDFGLYTGHHYHGDVTSMGDVPLGFTLGHGLEKTLEKPSENCLTQPPVAPPSPNRIHTRLAGLFLRIASLLNPIVPLLQSHNFLTRSNPPSIITPSPHIYTPGSSPRP